MNLNQRIQKIEIKIKTSVKLPGCEVTIFVIIPQDKKQTPFNTDTYKPTDEDVSQYLQWMKASGQCQDCRGSCALDWAPAGFTHHTLTGERNSSSPVPKISLMHCVDAETGELMRRLMKGERTLFENAEGIR